MFEYKVVSGERLKLDKPEKYEAYLNEMAREGWRFLPDRVSTWDVWEREKKLEKADSS